MTELDFEELLETQIETHGIATYHDSQDGRVIILTDWMLTRLLTLARGNGTGRIMVCIEDEATPSGKKGALA
jgi:hypothetical protein